MGEGAGIVIVEDEVIVALDIKRQLELNGYAVKGFFPTGEELLDRMETLHPDLVVMDIRLQGKLDGVETSALLNDRWGVPVIFITADADEETLSRAKITQPFGYIIKPFNERELRTNIEIALYRSRMEKKLRESERLLQQAQKMEAVGRLAGGIAHDFNNILTAILGYANLLEEEVGENKAVRKDVEGVKKAAKRAESLTRQLLAFSRCQPMEPRLISARDTLVEMELMLRRLLPPGVGLTMYTQDERLMVRMDPIQLEQIVLNLVVNARDAIPEGGSIEVRLGHRQCDALYTGSIEEVPPGQYVILTVRDTGVGIAQENFGKIFEPFFSTKTQDGGTGLGLATVYGIVKQSGGYLDLESQEGSGTSFTLYFPQLSDGGQRPAEPERDDVSAGGTETVLVVEDDEEIRTLMERVLTRKGYTVLPSAHPGEAVLIAERHSDKLDLVVSDIGLPLMSGPELVQRLRTMKPGLKILFISGYPEHSMDIEDAAFLPKPFTEAALSKEVRRVLDS